MHVWFTFFLSCWAPAPTLTTTDGIESAAGGDGIEEYVTRDTLPGGLTLALLPRITEGAKVHLALTIRFGSEAALKGKVAAARLLPALLLRPLRGSIDLITFGQRSEPCWRQVCEAIAFLSARGRRVLVGFRAPPLRTTRSGQHAAPPGQSSVREPGRGGGPCGRGHQRVHLPARTSHGLVSRVRGALAALSTGGAGFGRDDRR